MPKFDLQSHFSTSKIIGIFLNFFFIEEYQFRSTVFFYWYFLTASFLNFLLKWLLGKIFLNLYQVQIILYHGNYKFLSLPSACRTSEASKNRDSCCCFVILVLLVTIFRFFWFLTYFLRFHGVPFCDEGLWRIYVTNYCDEFLRRIYFCDEILWRI